MPPVSLILIAAIGLFIGAVIGWLYRNKTSSPTGDGEPPLTGLNFWDPHGCLNALNRGISERNNIELKDEPVYIVAAHLQMLVVVSKSGGWVTPTQLHHWLTALRDLHQYLHPAEDSPAYTVSLPDELVQLQIAPLGQALVPLLQKAGPISQVTIECRQISPNDHESLGLPDSTQKTQIPLRLSVTSLRTPPAGSDARPRPVDPVRSVDVICDATFKATLTRQT